METRTQAPCGHTGPPTLLYEGQDDLYGVPGRWSVVRCTTCGLAYTLPRPSPAELSSHYPPSTYVPYREEAARTTLRQRLGGLVDAGRVSAGMWFGAYRTLMRSRPGRLLDVGCGRGDLAAWFAARGWRAAGVEPAEKAAQQAAQRGVEVHHGTLDDAPWEPGSFDAVTFNHVLEHVPDPRLTLRQTAELLRPGGVLAVSVPNFGAWQRRLFGSSWFQLDLPRHLQHFDRTTLPRIVSEAGLQAREVRTFSSTSFLASVQFSLRGRLFLSEATTLRAMYLLYPAVLLMDMALREADCLHVVARRP